MGMLGLREGQGNPKVAQEVAGQALVLGSCIEPGVLSVSLREELGPRK